jgi:hypothetical protein
MKKSVFFLLASLALCRQSNATLPVVDYSHIAQDAGNEVVNFAKWTKTEIDAAQTQLNTLNTWENTVLQVARFGNPAALRSLSRRINGCGTRVHVQPGQPRLPTASRSRESVPVSERSQLNSFGV